MYDEMVEFKKEFDKFKLKNSEFILFPPVHYLALFKDSKYKVGTQNFYSYKAGSFTGEVNLEALKDMNINYTMIGHYERRKFIYEPYEIAKEKLFKSLNSKCETILCVGEQSKTRRPFSYIKKEISFYLKSIESATLKYLNIAYVPSISMGLAEKDISSIIGGVRHWDVYRDIIECTGFEALQKDCEGTEFQEIPGQGICQKRRQYGGRLSRGRVQESRSRRGGAPAFQNRYQHILRKDGHVG